MMKVAFLSAHGFERKIFDPLLERPEFSAHEITYFDARLTEETMPLAKGFPVVSIFVSDRVLIQCSGIYPPTG